MTDWTHSTYLDYAGYDLDVATPAAGSSQSPTEAAFGITHGTVVTDPSNTITLALTLGRANDPTALLSSNWGTRQRLLSQVASQGGVGAVYGASRSDYLSLLDQLGKLGIMPLSSTEVVSSAASRTVWVTLDGSQFKRLFGTDLMTGTPTIAPADFLSTPGSYTPTPASDSMLYWNRSLRPNSKISGLLSGIWIEDQATPTPVVTDATAVIPPDGNQGIGNSLKHENAIYPSQLAAIYNFPLSGTSVATPAIGMVENGCGSNVGVTGQTIGDYLSGYLQQAGVSGTVTVAEGTVEASTGAPSGNERSLDVSVAAAAAPNSNQVLYAGDGSGSYSSMEEAIWGADSALGSLSSSFSEPERSSRDSPFYAAYSGLMQDAALRNMSVFFSAGDGGSSEEIGEGVPMSDISHDSPYAVVVGGTSLSTQAQAAKDGTIATYTAQALAGNKTYLRQLVAGGLKTMPTTTSDLASFIETTWNDYDFKDNGHKVDGLTGNNAGAGGIDSAFDEPSYQTSFGIDIPSLSYSGTETGRGVPDVAAMSGGNNDFEVLAANGGGALSSVGGTSGAAPLWAALTAQIQAIFADQGLPTTGYYNDLLYTAAAVAPASFNDVTIGGNDSSFVYGGAVTDKEVKDGKDKYYQVTPTGIGYSASPGYDLTTGLGTPDGTLLARALTQIAHAELYSHAAPMTVSTGDAAGPAGVLLVQTDLASSGVVSVAGKTLSAEAAGTLQWSSQLAQQSLQSGFDPALVTDFDMSQQGATTQVSVTAGQGLDITLNGNAATAPQAALTSPYGFVTYVDPAHDAVTLARPVAVAQTALGADNQDAIVRMRQDGATSETLCFYRVDDLSGDIAGIAPGQAGYAAAAASRYYKTSDGSTGITGPGYGNQTTSTLVGVNAGDIIASELTAMGHDMWAFSAQNEVLNGASVNHIYNYGMNTWGYEDTYGGGDRDFNDVVFQLDFTSKSGHGYLA